MKSVKKRLISAVFAVLFLLTVAVSPVLAASNGDLVDVKELSLRISAPEGWLVFTRDTPADAPVFDEFEGIDKEYMDRLFQQNSIYFNAVEPNDASQEIVVTMAENPILFDWNGLSDAEYNQFADEVMNADMEKITGISGVKYDGDYELVDHPQCKLMKLNARIINDQEQTALIQYVTVINGQHINITLRSYTGSISSEEEKTLDQIVQEMEFTEVKERPFTIESLFRPEKIILTLCIGGGAVLLIVAVVIVCVVVGSNKRKEKRRLAQMQQERNDLYNVQVQPVIEPAPKDDTEDGESSEQH